MEHKFIKETHYDVQMNKIITETNIDLRYHSHTINDVVWSTAVQQGPSASIIITAINKIESEHSECKEYDSILIDEIYKERGKLIASGPKAGQLKYFSKNSLKVQDGVSQRFISESKKAKELLKNENDY